MAESSSHNPSSPEITPKEELITLDRPESPNPFLPADQIEFSFDEIAFTTKNEVALLYPSHPYSEYFREVSNFISKCCLKEAFTRAPTQYKEYLCEFWYTAKTLDDSKIWVSTPTSGIRGDIGYSGEIGAKGTLKKNCLPPRVNVDYAKLIWEDILHKLNKKTREKVVPYPRPPIKKEPALSSVVIKPNLLEMDTDSGTNEESRDDEISKKIKLEDLSDVLKDTRSAFFAPESLQDEPIIISNESEEEETEKDEDTHATSRNIPEDTSSQKEKLEQQKAKAEEEVASLKARPSYPDINHLTELLVTSLKPELSKLLASHNFASCLPTELKELPSKFTKLFGDIKELKQHVYDMDIKLLGDLKKILTKLETITSISSLTSQVAELKNIQWELPTEFLGFPSQISSVQKKLKMLDSLRSLLNKVTETLNRFATMVGNASGATTKDVPSAGQATTSPAKGEKNTNPATTDAEPNLHEELVDLLGMDVVTQYYNKKLLYDKYCDKMLKIRKSSKIINCEVLIQKGHISLKVHREDGTIEVILNVKVSDLHLA
ncbi:hypothetical protein Tco_0738414 [Tanacetum coccineum]